ncbi:MAG: hypothetical protein WAV90_18145 [Gordonia amarae]
MGLFDYKSRVNCPVCGQEPSLDLKSGSLYKCRNCGAMMCADERVAEATDATRLRFAKANLGSRPKPEDYPWDDPQEYLPRLGG